MRSAQTKTVGDDIESGDKKRKNRNPSTGTHVLPPIALSRQIKRLLRSGEINVVLDVGAYRGDYCKMLRERVGYDGMIVSFEPSADSFRFLKATMNDDSGWRGFGIGLSDKNTVATLNRYPGREMFNSVHTLRKEDAQSYNVNLAKRFSEKIRLRTIDTLWGEITEGISSPRVFMKMDTQGHDIAVIRGATGHLRFFCGIQSELPVIEIYDGMTPMHEALAFYRKLGFVPMGFYAVNTPTAYDGVSPEFDVVFKKL
jgi:FkbM family methyltransferase